MSQESPECPMTIMVQLKVGDRVNHIDDAHDLGVVSKRRVRPTRFSAHSEKETIVVEYHVQWDDETFDWYTYASLVRNS